MKLFSMLKFGILTLAIVTLTSCNSSKLQETVESANAQCPYDLGTMGTMTGITLEDGNVVFTYNVHEDSATLENLKAGEVLAVNLVNTMFANPDLDTKELLALIVSQQAGIRFVFNGETSGKTVESLITPDVLKVLTSDEKNAVLDKQKADTTAIDTTQAALLEEIERANALFPQNLGNGMTVERIELEGSYLVYHCLLDEQTLTIKAVEKDAQNIKKNMLSAIPNIRAFKELCKAHDKGLIYRYRGAKSENTFGIVITTKELGK